MQADKKLNIILWAFPSWNGDYMKSTVELAKELALTHRVLYIDYAYTLKDILFAKKNGSIPVKRILKQKESLQTIKLDNGGEINVLSLPPIIPFNWTGQKSIFKLIQRANYQIVSHRIKNALKILNFQTDIVINAFNPFFGNATLQLFAGSPVIYYCYDNIDASVWASKHGEWLEKEFASKVSAAIFSSDALLKNKNWGIPAHVVNNGVDLRNFSKPRFSSDFNKQKTIGYVGSVDDRLDFDLLEKVIEGNRQYQFQFIGRIVTDKIETLKKMPNVEFTGSVIPNALPGMMQKFDVGIIPFVKNDFTRNIYPMKVNEYLALGMPVVATGFAKFEGLNGFIETADEPITFSEKLKEVISGNNDNKRIDRRAKANLNSWEQKTIEFQNILLRYAG